MDNNPEKADEMMKKNTEEGMNQVSEDFFNKMVQHVERMRDIYAEKSIDYMVRNGEGFDLYTECHLIYGYLFALIKEKLEPIKGK